MADDAEVERKRKYRKSFGDDGKTPVMYFDNATVSNIADYISISLFDTERDANDPDKTPVRYLGTRLEGAKALRAALDEAIERWEERSAKS